MPSPNGFSGSLPRDRQWLAARADWHPALQAVPQTSKLASVGLRCCVSSGTYCIYPSASSVIWRVLRITRHRLQVALILQMDQNWVQITGNSSSFSLKKIILSLVFKGNTSCVITPSINSFSPSLRIHQFHLDEFACIHCMHCVVQEAGKHMPQSPNLGENEGSVFCLWLAFLFASLLFVKKFPRRL